MTKQELIMMIRHDIKKQRADHRADLGEDYVAFVRLNGTAYYIREGVKFEFGENVVVVKYGKLPIAHLCYYDITSVGYSFLFEDEVEKAVEQIRATGSLDGSLIKEVKE